MIYDRAMRHLILPAGSLLQGKLIQQGVYLYAEMTVYHRRFWESVQAGSRVDRMAALPGAQPIEAGDYCQLEDTRVYRVEQVQFDQDEFGLPRTVLSLSRTDRRFDIGVEGAE